MAGDFHLSRVAMPVCRGTCQFARCDCHVQLPQVISISRMFDPMTAHLFAKPRERVKAWRVPNEDGEAR